MPTSSVPFSVFLIGGKNFNTNTQKDTAKGHAGLLPLFLIFFCQSSGLRGCSCMGPAPYRRRPSGAFGRYGLGALRAQVARTFPKPVRPHPSGAKSKSPFGCGSPILFESPNAQRPQRLGVGFGRRPHPIAGLAVSGACLLKTIQKNAPTRAFTSKYQNVLAGPTSADWIDCVRCAFKLFSHYELWS